MLYHCLSYIGPLPPSVPTLSPITPGGSGLDLLAVAVHASKSGAQGATLTSGPAITVLGLGSHPWRPL